MGIHPGDQTGLRRPSGDDWRPMATADRDGDRPKHVRLLVDGQDRTGFWFGAYGWIVDTGQGEGSERFKQCHPTAWKPSPEPSG